MTNTNFFIVGKHPVIEALKNPQRKVLRLFPVSYTHLTLPTMDSV